MGVEEGQLQGLLSDQSYTNLAEVGAPGGAVLELRLGREVRFSSGAEKSEQYPTGSGSH